MCCRPAPRRELIGAGLDERHRGRYRLTFFLGTTGANARWGPARTSPAQGGYRIVLEFHLETAEALDAKHEELIGLGYASHCAPYAVTPELRFAMADDPDGNTILLSASTEPVEQ